MDRCDACDFVYADLALDEVPSRVRAMAPDYAQALDAAAAADRLRRRPQPDTWSPLEYACHVRDVLVVQHERLHLALAEDAPTFTSMRRDERAVEERYNEQDPADVVAALQRACEGFAEACARLTPDAWRRTGVYPWPQVTERDLAWLARHTVHELVHHLQDITRGVAGPPQPRGPRTSA